MKVAHPWPLLLILLWMTISSPPLSAGPVSFRKDIAPILIAHCQACHGPRKAEGEYRMDSYERAMQEGESGSAGFAAKELEESEAFRRIISDDAQERMPMDGDPLSAEQIALIKRWIEEGASFDGPDPKVSLAAIVPPPAHPDPPEVYTHAPPVTALVFSPDGKQLFAGGYHEVTVWNPENGSLLRRIKRQGQRTFALALSADGKLLAAASGSPGRLGELRLFDAATGKLVKVLGTTADVVFDAALSPQGDRLAIAAADSSIRVINLASGKQELLISSHSDWVFAVAWSPDGTKIASASRDKTSKLFDAKTGDLLVTYSGHAQPVSGVVFHPDGKSVLSGGRDNKIHQWNIADKQTTSTGLAKKSEQIDGFGGEVFKLITAGQFLFAPSADKKVRQYETKSRKQIREYSGHGDWVLSVAYHDGTKRLASGGIDGEVRIWNTADGKPVATFSAAPGYQTSAKSQQN